MIQWHSRLPLSRQSPGLNFPRCRNSRHRGSSWRGAECRRMAEWRKDPNGRHQWCMVFVPGQWPPVVGWPVVTWLWRWRCFNRGLWLFFSASLSVHRFGIGSGGDSFVMFWVRPLLDLQWICHTPMLNKPRYPPGNLHIPSKIHIKSDDFPLSKVGKSLFPGGLLSKFWILQPFQNGKDGQPCALLAAPLRSSSGCRWTLCPAIALPGRWVWRGWNFEKSLDVSSQNLPVLSYFVEFYVKPTYTY